MPTSLTDALRVQGGLLLRGRERPRSLTAALLAKDEAHLARRAQAVGMIGPVGRAGLVEIQRAEHVAAKEAVLAAHLRCGLRSTRLTCNRQPVSPSSIYDFFTGRTGAKRSRLHAATGIAAKRSNFLLIPQTAGIHTSFTVLAGSSPRNHRSFVHRMRVQLFVTCLVDLARPEVGERAVRLLERLGCQVDFPAAQTCCGQPAFNSGHTDAARPVADAWLRAFEPTSGPIVAPFGSCVHMVRQNFERLLGPRARADHGPRARLRRRSSSRISATRMSVGPTPARTARPSPTTTSVTCCAASAAPGTRAACSTGCAAARSSQPSVADLCCGFGGTFSLKAPKLSAAMADEKLDRAVDAGARALVSTDPGCLMHLEGRARRRGIDLRVHHLARPARAGRRPVSRVIHPPRAEPAPAVTVNLHRAAANWARNRAAREGARRLGGLARAGPGGARGRDRPPARAAHRARGARDRRWRGRASRGDWRRGVRGRRPRVRRARPGARGEVQVDADRGDRAQRRRSRPRASRSSRPTSASTSSSCWATGPRTSSRRRSTCPPIRSPSCSRARSGQALDRRRHRRARRRTRAARCGRRSWPAEVGITGVNFAVAETGTLVLVESEGNIRMASRCRRVHVAVMGIEKVVRDWDGAAHLVQMLPLAAHGRPAATYTSFVTGPGPRRRRRPRGAAPRARRRRPLGAARDRARGGPPLHPLRRVPVRLPGLPPDRRPRLRHRLLGPDRRGAHARARGSRPEHRRAAMAVVAVRRVHGGLPGEDPARRAAGHLRARARGGPGPRGDAFWKAWAALGRPAGYRPAPPGGKGIARLWAAAARATAAERRGPWLRRAPVPVLGLDRRPRRARPGGGAVPRALETRARRREWRRPRSGAQPPLTAPEAPDDR